MRLRPHTIRLFIIPPEQCSGISTILSYVRTPESNYVYNQSHSNRCRSFGAYKINNQIFPLYDIGVGNVEINSRFLRIDTLQTRYINEKQGLNTGREYSHKHHYNRKKKQTKQSK